MYRLTIISISCFIIGTCSKPTDTSPVEPQSSVSEIPDSIVSKGDAKISEIANEIIEVPRVPEIYSPIVNAVPLQLLAYHIAVLRGCDVDQPRNLAKSVTVE